MSAHYHVTQDTTGAVRRHAEPVTPAGARLTRDEARAELAAWTARLLAGGWATVGPSASCPDSSLALDTEWCQRIAYVEWCVEPHA